jgi:RNA polymerase sigma factor (sigma-70 family)
MTELYGLFSRSVRYSLMRQLASQDTDDMMHDAFIAVVQAIRRGDLREPERLMGFVRTIVRRQVATYIECAVQVRTQIAPLDPTAPLAALDATPEQVLMRREKKEIAETALQSISERDRQILVRFYILEQSQEEICRELGLSKTQFRLLKSRAKARFGAIGRKRVERAD